MNLVKHFLTNNYCYSNPTRIQVKYLVLHSIGFAQPSCEALLKSWDNTEVKKSIHAFVEADRVVQTLPWDYKGWHIGTGRKGSYNSCSIGAEICEPKGHTYKGGTMVGYDPVKNAAYFSNVYNNAVELFAKLCYDYGLDPLKDIYCHSEVYKLGYGSNHSDVMQWFPKHGKSMDIFRADVKMKMITSATPEKKYRVQVGSFTVKAYADKLAEDLKKLGYETKVVKA